MPAGHGALIECEKCVGADDNARGLPLDSFKPGQVWRDTDGNRIHAHGGSVLHVDGIYYWYGENKEKTGPGETPWHWGVNCYSSVDLYNWKREGIICAPEPEDRHSPLHPEKKMDRPHILYNEANREYVMWLKIMNDGQFIAVASSPNLLGPYRLERHFLPAGLNCGDFDLVQDPVTQKAYVFFGHPHDDIICADLTDDYKGTTGYFTRHFPHGRPPFAREAPAVFRRNGKLYMFTSGTTGKFPNASEVACSDDYHGPWTVLGDPHVNDCTGTSFHSQISSVLQVRGKDLHIALADRWLTDLPEDLPDINQLFQRLFDPENPEHHIAGQLKGFTRNDTSKADYVWLPVSFDNGIPKLHWHDEWRIEDF